MLENEGREIRGSKVKESFGDKALVPDARVLWEPVKASKERRHMV